jgi:serine/threonine protein kinase/tetratricopeptide (TPR) repeat protein
MPEHSDARAKAIFDQVIDLDGGERRAALERLCGGDTHLRERVTILLKGAETDDQFLREPSIGPPVDPVNERPGTRIGLYKILDLIGEGGFGSVFLAEQEHPVRRRVALKIIKLGMDTRAVVARFEQERQALALMDHPNIAKVFDAGATATGRPYFAMELVKGEPINEYCDKRRLSITDRLKLFTQVCSAVQHAHTKGIIHRDLKPGNVLVSDQGDAGPLAKVIDFGIAKAVDRPLTDKTVYTEQRQLVGTPEYMSPEQAEGSRDLDTRTDVYSLGVVLYELLTGLPPFDPERLRSAAYAEIQRIIREVDPPKPSTRLSQAKISSASSPTLAHVAAQRRVEPARLNTLLRGELDWIVMRALDKDRSRRYESPSALGADVQRYLNGEAVQAAPPSGTYRMRKFVRRHRAPVVAGLLVALALLLGSIGTGVGLLKARDAEKDSKNQAIRANQNAAAATAQAERADREAKEAKRSAHVTESVNELMQSMIKRADRGAEGGRADVTVREVMDAAARELEAPASKEDAPDPAVASALANTIGETYRELSLFEPAARMMRLHAEGEKSLHGESSVEYASALNALGWALKVKGDTEAARAAYAQAHDIAQKLGEPAGDVLAMIEVQQGVLKADADGDLDAAEALFNKVIARGEARGGLKTDAELEGLNNLAAVQYQKGKLDEAEANFKKSIDLRRSISGLRSTDLLRTLHNLGALQYSKHDTDAAVNTIREEVAMAKRVYGDVHIEVAEALNSLAIALAAKRDYSGALEARQQCIAMLHSLLAPDHIKIGEALRDLGNTYIETEQFDKAEEALRESCRIVDQKIPAGNSDLVFAHYQLALALAHRGAYAEAEATLRPSVEASAATLKEGERREWIRQAALSLLGEIVAKAPAAGDPPDAAARARQLAEAEKLIVPAAERFLVLQPKMGPRMRSIMIPAALQRAIDLYQTWGSLDPTPEHAQALATWKAKHEEFAKAAAAPAAPPPPAPPK